MADINDGLNSPLLLEVCFDRLLKYYEAQLLSENKFLASKASHILNVGNSVPVLSEGFTDATLLVKYKTEIDIILEDCFSTVLSKNEIKTASVPFHNLIFSATDRFKAIIQNAGKDFELSTVVMDDDEMYRVVCTIILRFHYHYDLKLKRPFFYEIPDDQGILRTYKILYNVDFVDILRTEQAPFITDADYHELLDNYDDIALWRSKFPPRSYIFKGFSINNIFEVTDDRSISEIKTGLLSGRRRQSRNFITNFQTPFEALFNTTHIKVGFILYNDRSLNFERLASVGIESFLLQEKEVLSCATALSSNAYTALIEENRFFCIGDVEDYIKTHNHPTCVEILNAQGIKSAIFAPIANEGKLLGVLELVSDKVNALNSVNANLLWDVIPFVVASVLRGQEEEKNLIEAVIQQECTSIHPSVYWKFEQAAKVFLDHQAEENSNVTFGEITFQDVFPLFGQIDVKGSSEIRNKATRRDLTLQLELVKTIIDSQIKIEPLPIYNDLQKQVLQYLYNLNHHFNVDSEPELVRFFEKDIHPLFEFINLKNGPLTKAIITYFEKINKNLNLIYFYRKQYDDTISLINKNMSSLLDLKQIEAQLMFPHYFERYKTDGVEHNIYIGPSISKTRQFKMEHLYNLRLWQIQVMCDMENNLYNKSASYPTQVTVASMILVFHQPLTIQFRTDEKRFDVYGTYNARYEVVKKRVDKALIKDTTERITQTGKLTIVYSLTEDGIDYLKYLKFLQEKNVLGTEVETLELEDLQGITGLKALRVPILYNRLSNLDAYYTYTDFKAHQNV